MEEIIRNGSWSIIAKVIEKVGSLAFIILLTRILYTEDFGIFSLLISLASYFLIFSDFVGDAPVIKFLSQRKTDFLPTLKYLIKTKLKFLIAGIILFIILSYPLSLIYKQKIQVFFILLYIIMISFSNFLTSCLFSIKRVKLIAFKEFLFQFSKLFVLFLIFLISRGALSTINSYGAIFIITIASLFSFLIALSLLNLSFVELFVTAFSIFKSNNHISKETRKEIFKFSKSHFLSVLLGFFYTNIDIIILGIFISVEYLGFYKIASSFTFGVLSLFTSLFFVLIPSYKNNPEVLLRKYMRTLFILGILITSISFFFSKFLVSLFFPPSFLVSVLPIKVFSFVFIINLPLIALVSYLYFRNKPEIVTKSLIIASFISLSFNFLSVLILSPISESLSLVGAAFTLVISKLVIFIFLLLRVNRLNNKNTIIKSEDARKINFGKWFVLEQNKKGK